MYIHSVKLINYKSIGDYDESEIIVEPRVTAIIGKNESGKSNILEGLSQIDFYDKKIESFSPDKLNRCISTDSEIKYFITLKPSTEDQEVGITEETCVTISKNKYSVEGGIATYYGEYVRPDIEIVRDILVSKGNNPFNTKNEELANYRKYIEVLNDAENLDIPQTLKAVSFIHKRIGAAPSDIKNELSEALLKAEDHIKECCSRFPHFFYRRTDKGLKTNYKLEEVEKELKNSTINSTSLLFDFVRVLEISNDDFISAVRIGGTSTQISLRKRINRIINEKINIPFREFYTTEQVSLELDFNNNSVTFTIQTENGENLLLSERSNGLRWYLDTFIDAHAHSVTTKNAIYLLDEPGVSLHVNAQRELVKLFNHLAEQGNQVIYTTHSPYMLDTVDDGVHRIRAAVKDDLGFTRIYKTAYDYRIAPSCQKDTLAPIIQAIGMNLNDTFGPAKDKINIVTEGMSDYIYLCMMAKVLNVDSEKYAIIPSVGASNCINICSILHGWGCKYIAVLDYDKAGVETCGEHMRKDMFFEMGKQFCYIKDVSQQDIDERTYIKNTYMIEDVVTESELERFRAEKGISETTGKPLTAKLFSNAVENGTYTMGKECVSNFAALYERIFSCLD